MFLASIKASSRHGKLVPNYHVCTHAIRIWDAYTGAELFSLEGHEEGVLEACFSPCGKYVASTSTDGTVRLWKINDGPDHYHAILASKLFGYCLTMNLRTSSNLIVK